MALTRILKSTIPAATPIGLGCMGFGAFYGKPSTSEDTQDALTHAFNQGSRLWDTADCYGDSELFIGEWMKKNPELRKEVFLCSKFGFADMRKDFSFGSPCSDPEYIPIAFKKSLERLQTPYLDLYYQHRTDPAVPIELAVEAFRPFFDNGQLRYLGLSECSIDTLKRARAVPGLGEKVIAAQMEYSPFTLDVEKNGFAKACAELDVTLVTYSPLARGLISGRFRSREDFDPSDGRLMLERFSSENFPKNVALIDIFDSVGKKLGFTSCQVALAWILAAHPDWILIPGARSKDRIEENTQAEKINLAPEDVKEIRALVEKADVAGDRYPAQFKNSVAPPCITLEEYQNRKDGKV